MKSKEEIELELNEYPDPTSFHDMPLINIKFLWNSIQMKFMLSKYMDVFGILDDDNHYAILEVKYEGINIKNMNLDGLMDFRNSDVFELSEKEGIIHLNIYNDCIDSFFYLEFTCENYKWKLNSIISENEYDKYSSMLEDFYDCFNEYQKTEFPDWSNFENEK